VAQILNVLENFDVSALEINSPEYLHLFSEVFKACYADRAAYMGDPHFVKVPLEGLLSKEYAREIAGRIDLQQAKKPAPGDPWPHESISTTHFSIMDSEGNLVAVTRTINHFFGSCVVPEGAGFLLNDEMEDFSIDPASANAVAGSIDNLACIAGNAINLAMVTVIGQCVGNGDVKQVEYYMKKMMLWAYGFWFLNSLPTLIFCRPLIGFYSTLSQETADLAFRLIWIHNGLGILLWPMSFTLPNALRAANDVQFTMRVGIASMLIVRVGLSWIFCVILGWGATGVWIAMVADWIVRISFFLPRILSGKWKKLCGLA
jgi:hypothetical protein